MAIELPPHVSEKDWNKAISGFQQIVGEKNVLNTDYDRTSYRDIYAPAHVDTHKPSAAVLPTSVEEVQGIVRVANETKVPLWTIARGKNLGYGSSAPVKSGSVVLDLSRLNKIIDVDVDQASCLIEPGVGFFDLYNYIRENEIPLWISPPSHAWGSVVGNALDRGAGYTPYGEHAANLCGLEVVLPTGDLMRTGAGAMSNSKTWQNFRTGFGPSWETMFAQSNFGVVTKAGMWLMPEPDITHNMKLSLRKPEDIIWAIDLIAKLRRTRVIDSHVTIGSPIRFASLFSQRKEWYDGEDAVPDDVVEKMMEKYNIGYWNFNIRLFGNEAIVAVQAKIIKAEFATKTSDQFDEETVHKDDPIPFLAINVPTAFFLQVANWHGGRGAHTDVSPVVPLDGKTAYEQYKRSKRLYDKHGIDFYFGYTLAERYMTNVNMMIYDRDNEDMFRRVDTLFHELTAESKEAGYGAYRTHVDYMDEIAKSYDFNDNALLKLNQTVKDALDPNGILSPGKSGIWPERFRQKGGK